MRLYSESHYANSASSISQGNCPQSESAPVLVFLHGLLGSGRDWLQVINQLSGRYTCLTIDLPGHGHSRFLPADGLESAKLEQTSVDQAGFAQTSQWLSATLAARGVKRYILVGYSLGARVAMYHACHQIADGKAQGVTPQLCGLILEGGHFGLPQGERFARLENDQRWAQRFAKEPICDVLADWYQQPVFSSLNHDQRQGLIAKRSDNLGSSIARMLLATSLAKQPLLQSLINGLPIPVHYLCGEKDQKFTLLAAGSDLSYQVIEDAGHNVHVEQPYLFARAVDDFILRTLF